MVVQWVELIGYCLEIFQGQDVFNKENLVGLLRVSQITEEELWLNQVMLCDPPENS